MKVHYSRWIIVPLLVTGLVCLGLGIWVALLGGTAIMQIAIGAIILLDGLLFLKTPVFALEPNSIALYRPIGRVRKRFPFQSHSEIRVNGSQLFVGKARVPIRRWYLDRSQWQAFEESIGR